jgi:hypothetical protein
LSKLAGNGWVYETFGISKRFPIKPLRCLLNVLPLKLALSAKCFIYRVTNWPLFIKALIINLLHRSVSALVWDGLEGSFGIFGLRASLVGMPNVPESEGMV